MDNASALMEVKYVFDPSRCLNKTVLFDTSKIDEDQIVDMILENIPACNGDVYPIHKLGTNGFSLRCKDGT